MHREFGAGLGAAGGLDAVGQDFFLHPHQPVAERVVRHRVAEVPAERPVDPFQVFDRVLLHGEAAHARQALAEHQVLIEPSQIIVQIRMVHVVERDVVAVLVGRLDQDRFQRCDVAPRQIEGEVFLAGEVGTGPRHRIGHLFGVDRGGHPSS